MSLLIWYLHNHFICLFVKKNGIVSDCFYIPVTELWLVGLSIITFEHMLEIRILTAEVHTVFLYCFAPCSLRWNRTKRAREPLPVSPTILLGVDQYCQSHFHMSARALNSGPRACTESQIHWLISPASRRSFFISLCILACSHSHVVGILCECACWSVLRLHLLCLS